MAAIPLPGASFDAMLAGHALYRCDMAGLFVHLVLTGVRRGRGV